MQAIVVMTLGPLHCYDFLLTAQLLWLGTRTQASLQYLRRMYFMHFSEKLNEYK